MGIITRIEDKLGDIVESPFRDKNGLDLLGIEICLKRLMELKRRNIIGKVIVPNDLIIIINKKAYEEYEPFLYKFKATLVKSLYGWMKEKGYELAGQVELNFEGAFLKNKPFEVFVSYKKANGGNGSNVKTESKAAELKDTDEEKKIVVGELVNSRTGEKFRINQNIAIIGRGEDCTIRINDPTISRKHASLSLESGKVILKDLGSRTGTRVNHEKVNKTVLNRNDRIRMGCAELIFISYHSN